MRFGGFRYNHVTGDFVDVPGAKRKDKHHLRWSFPRLSFPEVRLPRVSFPNISLPRLRLPKVRFPNWSFGSAIGSILGFIVLIVSCLVRPIGRLLYWVFYPVVKWWQMEWEALAERDWMMVILWAFPGLFLYGIYKYGFYILFGLAGNLVSQCSFESLHQPLAIGAIVGYVLIYAKALSLVKRGRLVVYSDWGDFAKSVAWIILIPLGLGWCMGYDQGFLMRATGVLTVCLGLYCLGCLFVGAFLYNSGGMAWLSLVARIEVAVLFVFAVAKLQERLDLYRRGRLGVVRGVLIPLVVFASVFNVLVKPMVGESRY